MAMLTLTPYGRGAGSRLAEARRARFELLIARISAEARQVVRRGLDVLIGALDAVVDDNRTVAESGEGRR